MERRRFLQCAGFAAFSAGALTSSCGDRSRGKVLSALVLEVMIPGNAAAVAATKQLRLAVSKLVGTPSTQTLQPVREEWKKALLSWKRADCFPGVSTAEPNEIERVMSWPTRPAAVDVVLDGSRPMDEHFLEEIGADAKGLFGLEYLLFTPGVSESAIADRFVGVAGARRRRFVAAIVKDLVARSEGWSSALRDGKVFSETFAQAGQDSVNRLVAQMASTTAVAAQRIGALLAFDRGQVPATEVEGGPSGMSREIALAQIGGTEQLYRGAGAGGVGELVRVRSAASDERLQAAFAGAKTAVQKVGGPFEQAVGIDRATVEAAGAATKALALALKTDLATALGVTLKTGG